MDEIVPGTLHEITNESIWLNINITSAGKPIYWKSWDEKGIYKVGHLLNDEGIFYSEKDICEKYRVQCTFLNVLQLRQSIPKNWRDIIVNSNHNPYCDSLVINKQRWLTGHQDSAVAEFCHNDGFSKLISY